MNIVQMTVTWTSGYGKKDADAVVQWGTEVGKESWLSPASTLTFTRHDMCGRSLNFILCTSVFRFSRSLLASHIFELQELTSHNSSKEVIRKCILVCT